VACPGSSQTGYAFPEERDVAGFGVSGKSKRDKRETGRNKVKVRGMFIADFTERPQQGRCVRKQMGFMAQTERDPAMGLGGGGGGRAHHGKEEKSLGATSQRRGREGGGKGGGERSVFPRDSFSGRAKFASATGRYHCQRIRRSLKLVEGLIEARPMAGTTLSLVEKWYSRF